VGDALRFDVECCGRPTYGTGSAVGQAGGVTDPAAEPVRLCFVCLGNICRSPTAEGVMARLVADAGLADRIEVDSAGTGAWHVGDGPDPRSMTEARRRGVELTSRARQFHPGDFYRYDLVLAMDARNLADLRDLAPEAHLRDRARLLRAFDPALAISDTEGTVRGPFDLDVPDPYYEADDGFRTVFDMVAAACRGLLDHVRTHLL
jgi:protein-tyrosine phosphatase